MGIAFMFDLIADIEKAILKYPSLRRGVFENIPFVSGTFTAHDKVSGIEIEQYDVLILFPNNYPKAFPKVMETSGKIPRELSRHVRTDHSLCLGNLQDEFNACRNGITFTWFLDMILNTHLCREYVKEKTNEYPTGERSHGIEGIWEGYYEVLNTTDKMHILNELGLVLTSKSLGRGTPCYCNSGKKFKACHEKIEPILLSVGRNNLISIYRILSIDFKS